MEIYAVLMYTHKAELQEKFEGQLEKAGIPIIHIQDPQFSWRKQMLYSIDVADAHPDDVLVFPDAWDTLLLGTKQELYDLKLDKGITLTAAKNCWPHPEKFKQFPQVRTPWKYINANPKAGLGRTLSKALKWGWERFPIQGESLKVATEDFEVPERFLTDLYLQGRALFDIKIDYKCRLSQVQMALFDEDIRYEYGRIYNRLTKSWPVFFHVNATHDVPEELK